MFANHANPIAGWHWASLVELDNNKAISNDFQDYINKMPVKERKYIGYHQYFTDGAGQHAVTILVDLDGTGWTHVLIYDQNSKRVQVIKYISGHYRC
jgi:hypothetical protein